jgi:acyl-coenzyme A thioesterase PaaI-like protein
MVGGAALDFQSLEAAGWARYDVPGYTGTVCPFWTRKDADGWVIGVVIEPAHANSHIHTAHGGMLLTFADVAFGFGVSEALGHARIVTVQLQMQYLSVARVGEFLTCRPEIVRQSASLLFVRGLFHVGEKAIASADGIWKVIEPK